MFSMLKIWKLTIIIQKNRTQSKNKLQQKLNKIGLIIFFFFCRFSVASPMMFYSVLVFIGNIGYIVYMQYDRVKINSSSEGKFEEAAIDYLFITYLIPIIVVPVMWYETKRIATCYTLWSEFEVSYFYHKKRIQIKKNYVNFCYLYNVSLENTLYTCITNYI